MKRFLIALTVTAAIAFGASSQTVIDVRVEQNPRFEVSTNTVEVDFPSDGGGLFLGGDVVVTGGSGEYTYRWADTGDNTLSEESTYYAQTPGIYRLDVSDTCDCLQTVYFYAGTTAIDGVETQSLTISPNPTDGPVSISGFEPVRIAAVDMSGRLVKVVESRSGMPLTDVDFSPLAAGEYILTLSDGKGKAATARLLKR